MWPYLILFDFIWSPPTIWSHSEDMEPQWTNNDTPSTAHHSARRTGHQLRLLLDLLFRMSTGGEIRSNHWSNPVTFTSHSPVVAVVGCWTDAEHRYHRHRLNGVQNSRLKEWYKESGCPQHFSAQIISNHGDWRKSENIATRCDKFIFIWFHMLSELRWADPDIPWHTLTGPEYVQCFFEAFTWAWVKAVVANGGSTSQMKGSIEVPKLGGTLAQNQCTKQSWRNLFNHNLFGAKCWNTEIKKDMG